MAIYNGPNLVTDGLILLLDAADRNSYPGSGATWTDVTLSGRNVALANSPSFDTSNGGNIIFNGSTQSGSIASLTPITTVYTFDMFCQWIANNTTNGRLLGSNNTVPATTNYYVFDPTNVSFRFGNITLTSSVNVGVGSWAHIAVVVDSTTTSSLYVNGALRASTGSVANTPLNLYFGNQASSSATASNCSFGNFHMYNRALSATEIAQNYNAIRSRFRLAVTNPTTTTTSTTTTTTTTATYALITPPVGSFIGSNTITCTPSTPIVQIYMNLTDSSSYASNGNLLAPGMKLYSDGIGTLATYTRVYDPNATIIWNVSSGQVSTTVFSYC